MAAYFIAQYIVKDPALYSEYQKGAGPTIAASRGELISFDVAAETIEGTPPGFSCCPTPGCDGKGFGFDTFPIDPDYRDEQGNRMWMEDDDDDEEYDAVDEYVAREREVEDREVDAGRQPPVEDAEDDIPW